MKTLPVITANQEALCSQWVKRWRTANPSSRAEKPYVLMRHRSELGRYLVSLIDSKDNIPYSGAWPLPYRIQEWQIRQRIKAAALMQELLDRREKHKAARND